MTPIKTVLMQRLVAGLPPELGEKGFRMKSRFPYLFVLGKRAKNNLMILSCSPLLPMIGFRRKEGFFCSWKSRIGHRRSRIEARIELFSLT